MIGPTDTKINVQYITTIVGSVLFTWLLHEFVHWFTAEILGYTAVMQLNGTAIASSQNVSELDQAIVSISAPLITVFQALVAFFCLKKQGWNQYLYPFLLVPFYMRLLAGLMNAINPNDEGRVGEFLGIGLYTIPVVVGAFLFFLVYKTSKKYQLKSKFQWFTVLLIMFFSSVLILADQFFKIRIL